MAVVWVVLAMASAVALMESALMSVGVLMVLAVISAAVLQLLTLLAASSELDGGAEKWFLAGARGVVVACMLAAAP